MSRAAVTVTVALGLLVGAGTLLPAERPVARAAEAVPVVGATVVCPDLRAGPGGLTSRVSVGVAGGSGGGRVTAQRLTGGTPPVPINVHGPGRVAGGLAQQVNGDALLVRAEGPLAGGLEVEQVTRAAAGSERGLAGLRCAPARTDAWWVGGATGIGDSTTLVLANPDETPAVVDVTVLTATGPADTRPGRGLTLAPRSRSVVALDSLAPDRQLLAVHVRSVRGRFAGGLRHVRFDGSLPQGVDWVPQAGQPDREVVVPGIPAGPGRRLLQVTNPGPDDAVVRVQLTTEQGQSVPAALAAIAVPGGSSVGVDLTALLADSAGTARVISAGDPVLAAAVLTDALFAGGQPVSSTRELAWLGAAQPLAGPALVSDVVLDRPTESSLLLSALDRDAHVVVAPVAAGSPVPLGPARAVEIPAGRTVVVPLSSFLPAGTPGRLGVEVRPVPGSGAVWASRYLRERTDGAPLVTSMVLQSAAAQVVQPVVRPDPLAG